MITIQAGYALVLDDEPANRDFLERLLQTAGFKVTGAATGADGLRAARAFPELALALVDHELPDAKGLEIIAKLREENPESLLVMATMHDDRALIDEAFNAGVDVFLVKPHGFMELYRRLQEVDSNTALLRRLVIDQYGPRPYRGAEKRSSQDMGTLRPDEEVTRPISPTRTQLPTMAALNADTNASPSSPATAPTTATTPAANTSASVPASTTPSSAPAASVPATSANITDGDGDPTIPRHAAQAVSSAASAGDNKAADNTASTIVNPFTMKTQTAGSGNKPVESISTANMLAANSVTSNANATAPDANKENANKENVNDGVTKDTTNKDTNEKKDDKDATIPRRPRDI